MPGIAKFTYRGKEFSLETSSSAPIASKTIAMSLFTENSKTPSYQDLEVRLTWSDDEEPCLRIAGKVYHSPQTVRDVHGGELKINSFQELPAESKELLEAKANQRLAKELAKTKPMRQSMGRSATSAFIDFCLGGKKGFW